MLLRDMVGRVTSPWVRRYSVLKRFVLLLTVAAVMLAMSALPALARSNTEFVCCKDPDKSGTLVYVNTNTDVFKFPGGSVRY
jgi:hypothetical protein